MPCHPLVILTFTLMAIHCSTARSAPKRNDCLLPVRYQHSIVLYTRVKENNKLIHSAESMVFLAVDHGKGNMFIRQKSAGIQTSYVQRGNNAYIIDEFGNCTTCRPLKRRGVEDTDVNRSLICERGVYKYSMNIGADTSPYMTSLQLRAYEYNTKNLYNDTVKTTTLLSRVGYFTLVPVMQYTQITFKGFEYYVKAQYFNSTLKVDEHHFDLPEECEHVKETDNGGDDDNDESDVRTSKDMEAENKQDIKRPMYFVNLF